MYADYRPLIRLSYKYDQVAAGLLVATPPLRVLSNIGATTYLRPSWPVCEGWQRHSVLWCIWLRKMMVFWFLVMVCRPQTIKLLLLNTEYHAILYLFFLSGLNTEDLK
jgi:hypothetical protein